MKIGFFTNAYLPMVSGVVNSIELIRKELEGLDHSVYIIAPRYPGYPDRTEKIFRYPSLRLTRKVDFPLPIPFSPRLSAVLRKIPFDIIHAQHPFLLGSLGAKLAREKNIPLVFTFHTQYEQYVHYAPFGIPRVILRKTVEKMVSSFLKKCDSVIIPSPSLEKFLEKYGELRRTDFIPNAISLSRFKNADGKQIKKKYGLEGKLTLVFAGRLAPEKKLEFLLRAFLKITTEIPNAHLLFIGDGPSWESLQKQVRRFQLGQNVTFTGMIPYERIPDYLAAAELFVMTSTTEVKPLALLEAMAAGIPVVAVEATGAVDTITSGINGILTREKEEEFAEAVMALLRNEEKRREMGAMAGKKAKEFGSPALAERLLTLYEELRRNHSSAEA